MLLFAVIIMFLPFVSSANMQDTTGIDDLVFTPVTPAELAATDTTSKIVTGIVGRTIKEHHRLSAAAINSGL